LKHGPEEEMNVSKIAENAMKHLGILASGESASGDELMDVIEALEGLLAQWATSKLYVYKSNLLTIELTKGAGIYYIGVVDDKCCNYQVTCCDEVVTSLPDIESEISMISDTAWLDDCEIKIIRDVNNTSNRHYVPVWYRKDYPNWEFHVLETAKTLILKTYSLPHKLKPKDELQFPPNYKRPLELTLALEIAPMFGTEPSVRLVQNQDNAIEMLKSSNSVPAYSSNDLPVGVRNCHDFYN